MSDIRPAFLDGLTHKIFRSIFCFCVLMILPLSSEALLSILPGTNNPVSATLPNTLFTREMLSLRLVVSNNEAVILDRLTFRASGTGDDATAVSAASLKLYVDDGNGIYDGFESMLGTAQSWDADNGVAAFSGLGMTLAAGTTNHFLLVCQFAGTARLGDSFRASLSTADVDCRSTSAGSWVRVTDGPVVGGTVSLGGDLGSPFFFPGIPWTLPEVATLTMVTQALWVDKSIAGGGFVHQDVNDYGAGSASTTNLFKGNQIRLVSPYIRAGNPVLDRGNYGNITSETAIDNGAAWNAPGWITRFSYFMKSAASTPVLRPKIYASVTNVSNRVVLNLPTFTPVAGSNAALYAPGTYAVTNDGDRLGATITGTANRQRFAFTTVGGDVDYVAANDGTVGSNTGAYAAFTRIYSLYAEGYAMGNYVSRVMDSGLGSITYHRMSWNETLRGGSNQAFLRASNSPANIALASWVPVTNGQNLGALFADQRYVQYRMALTAATNGTNGPIIENVRILFNTNAVPVVKVVQANGATQNATFLSGSGRGPYLYTFTPQAGGDGLAHAWSAAWDTNLNGLPTNQWIGSFIVDNGTNQVGNLTCWRDATRTLPVTNGVAIPRERLFYNWSLSAPVTPSGVTWFWWLDGNPLPTSISNTSSFNTTNLSLDDQDLPDLTNYFHLRPRSGAGTWGAERVFTNMFTATFFTVDGGLAQPPDRTLLGNAQGVTALQFDVTAPVTGDVAVTNLVLSARTTNTFAGNDATAIQPNSFQLFRDDNSNGVADGADYLIQGARSITADNGSVTFSGFYAPVAAGTRTSFVVSYNFSGMAPSGSTFAFSILSNQHIRDATAQIANGAPVYGSVVTTTAPGTLALSSGSANPGSASILSNANGLEMLQMKITVGSGEGVRVSQVRFRASGTGNDLLHLAQGGVRLYIDEDGDGALTASDSLLAGGATYDNDNGLVTFPGLGLDLPNGSVTNLLLVYQLNGTAPDGATFQAQLEGLGDISCIGILTATPITANGSLVSGGTMTVGADGSAPRFSAGSPFVTPSPAPYGTVTLKLQSDEPVYSGGQSIAFSDLSPGTGDTTNLTKTTLLTLPTPRITAGNAITTRAGTSRTHDRNTTIDVRTPVSLPGVLTRWAAQFVALPNPATLTFKVFETNAGQAFRHLTEQTFTIPGTGARTNLLTPGIDITNQRALIAFYTGNNNNTTLVANDVSAGACQTIGVNNTNGTGYAVDNNLYSFMAEGYAVANYTSAVTDSGMAGSAYHSLLWDENLRGGSATFRVRAADSLPAIAAAPWSDMHRGQVFSNLVNGRYFQFAVRLEADPTLFTSPVVSNIRVVLNVTNRPLVHIAISNTNLTATWISNAGTRAWAFSFVHGPTNGTATVLASGFDALLNGTNLAAVGTYVVDGQPPVLSNLACWRDSNQVQPVTNGLPHPDNTVSYTWSNPDSLSGNIFYYWIDTQDGMLIRSNSAYPFSDKPRLNDRILAAGTNYFHMQGRTGSGVWGNELLFTNVYAPADLLIGDGDFNPGNGPVLSQSTNVVALQFRLAAGGTNGVTVNALTFQGNGTGNITNGLMAIRLYRDNNNGVWDAAADTPLAVGGTLLPGGRLAFTNLNLSIAAQDTLNAILVYDLTTGAQAGETFQFSLRSNQDVQAFLSGSTNIEPAIGAPLTGPLYTVVPRGTLTVSAGPSNTVASVISNLVNNQVMFQVLVGPASNDTLTVTNMVFSASGTGNDLAHIVPGSIRLYHDANANGRWDAGETNIGSPTSFSSNDGSATFGGFAITLNPGQAIPLIGLANFNGTATNGLSFRMALRSASDIGIRGTLAATAIPTYGLPVYGGTLSIGADTTAPVISPYGAFVSVNPTRLTTNLVLTTVADEFVRSSNGSSTNFFPRITVVQGVFTNLATWISGLNLGPFTHVTPVTNVDGVAEVWAQAFDESIPTPNGTNMLVGTFVVDTTPPSHAITNYTNFSINTNTFVQLLGVLSESNTRVTVEVAATSNGTGIFSTISNIPMAARDLSVVNLLVSNTPPLTNWIRTIAVDGAGNAFTNGWWALVAAVPEPQVRLSISNLFLAPNLGYGTSATELVPGSIVEVHLNYTNLGPGPATNLVVEQDIPVNIAYFVSNSMTGTGALFDHSTGSTYAGYTPVSLLDPNIRRIRFTIPHVPPATRGQLRYRLCVK